LMNHVVLDGQRPVAVGSDGIAGVVPVANSHPDAADQVVAQTDVLQGPRVSVVVVLDAHRDTSSTDSLARSIVRIGRCVDLILLHHQVSRVVQVQIRAPTIVNSVPGEVPSIDEETDETLSPAVVDVVVAYRQILIPAVVRLGPGRYRGGPAPPLGVE